MQNEIAAAIRDVGMAATEAYQTTAITVAMLDCVTGIVILTALLVCIAVVICKLARM